MLHSLLISIYTYIYTSTAQFTVINVMHGVKMMMIAPNTHAHRVPNDVLLLLFDDNKMKIAMKPGKKQKEN